MVPINDSLAYVSTMYFSKIEIINTRQFQVVGSIDMPYKNTESMLLQNGAVYVCNWDTANKMLYKINPANHTITDSIELAGKAPHSLVQDSHQDIWVFCGNKNSNTPSSITVLRNEATLKTYHFDAAQDIIRPLFNPQNDMLYFINIDYEYKTTQGVYKMHIDDIALPSQPFIKAVQFQYFYHITLDTFSQQLYVADPKGFLQSGDMFVYDLDGNLRQSISCGVGTSKVLFP